MFLLQTLLPPDPLTVPHPIPNLISHHPNPPPFVSFMQSLHGLMAIALFYCLFGADEMPLLHQLVCLTVGGKKLRLIESMGSDWKKMAYYLKFEDCVVENIQRDTVQFGCDESCRECFRRWLNGEACRPVTWERLIEALRDAKKDTLATRVTQFLGP